MRPTFSPNPCARFSYTLLACVALAVTLVTAQPAAAQDAALQQALAAYRAADFDKAIELFSTVAEDESADKLSRRQALQHLGRSYVAKRQEDRARNVMAQLIELEPPIVELNPDDEPLPLMKLYYEVRKELTDTYEMPSAQPTAPTLAVIDFTNSSIGDDFEKYAPLEKGLASMMINSLNGATDLKVIERERLQWLLQELQLQKSDMVDQATAVRAGKLLGAKAVLIGGYTVAGSRMLMSARLVNVETGEILLAERTTGKPNDFFDLVEKLSGQVAQAVKGKDLVKAGAANTRANVGTKSMDAVLAYSEGLALYEQEDYMGARAKFAEALRLDPNFEKAKQKSESLMPLLAAR